MAEPDVTKLTRLQESAKNAVVGFDSALQSIRRKMQDRCKSVLKSLADKRTGELKPVFKLSAIRFRYFPYKDILTVLLGDDRKFRIDFDRDFPLCEIIVDCAITHVNYSSIFRRLNACHTEKFKADEVCAVAAEFIRIACRDYNFSDFSIDDDIECCPESNTDKEVAQDKMKPSIEKVKEEIRIAIMHALSSRDIFGNYLDFANVFKLYGIRVVGDIDDIAGFSSTGHLVYELLAVTISDDQTFNISLNDMFVGCDFVLDTAVKRIKYSSLFRRVSVYKNRKFSGDELCDTMSAFLDILYKGYGFVGFTLSKDEADRKCRNMNGFFDDEEDEEEDDEDTMHMEDMPGVPDSDEESVDDVNDEDKKPENREDEVKRISRTVNRWLRNNH